MSREKTAKIIEILKKEYPDAQIALKFSTDFELLVATMLSAQCTDKRVNIVTGPLFKKYRSVSDWANAKVHMLENEIRSVGFFRNKAKNIIATARIIRDKFNGHIPDNMQELVGLPGIARKTANIILYNVFSKNEGIAVDTHVRRLALRIGLTQSNNPVRIEKNLMRLVLRRDWGRFNHFLVKHGRIICIARAPLCAECSVSKYCDYFKRKHRKY